MGRVRTLSAIAIGPRLVALLLGLAGPTPPVRLADLPAEAEVIVAALDVFDEPDDAVDRTGAAPAGRPGHGPRRRAPGLAGDRTAARLVLLDRAVRPRHCRPTGPRPRGRPERSDPLGPSPGQDARPPARRAEAGDGRPAPQSRTPDRRPGPRPADLARHRAAARRRPPHPRRGGPLRFQARAKTETKTDPRPAPPAEIRTGYAPPQGESPISPEVAARDRPDRLHSTARSSASRSSSGVSRRSASVMRHCSRA